jgi:hypothetical protein
MSSLLILLSLLGRGNPVSGSRPVTVSAAL